jgi:hypothetical protein
MDFVTDVLEGRTSMTCNFCNYVLCKNAFPPEDIALRAAEAVAIFQATLEGTNPLLGPWDVLTMAEHWRDVLTQLSEALPSFAQALPDGDASERERRSIATVEAALGTVVSTLSSLKAELDARVDDALTDKNRTGLEAKERRVFSVKSLSELNVRSLLLQYDEPGPIFAVEANVDLLPRLADSKLRALGCKCAVPWHERDLWERRAFSQYKLPLPTSPWQSQSLKLQGGISETIWVQQGAARDSIRIKQGDAMWVHPGNLFSFGTIPQSHRGGHGRELLAGVHMRTMFHTCWISWRHDEDLEEGSAEELGHGEDDEKASKVPGSASTGTLGDASASGGCLWMWVLGCLGNGNNGRHVVAGMRYPNFADMWEFIMRRPFTTLVPFEGMCRMEAAADLHPVMLAHSWYNEASHWTDAADGKGCVESKEPGSASSFMHSDQQKRAAQKWLNREIARRTAAVTTEEEENEEEEGSAATRDERETENEEEEERDVEDETDAETEDDPCAGCVTPTRLATRDSPPDTPKWLKTPEKVLPDQDSDWSPQELPDSSENSVDASGSDASL